MDDAAAAGLWDQHATVLAQSGVPMGEFKAVAAIRAGFGPLPVIDSVSAWIKALPVVPARSQTARLAALVPVLRASTRHLLPARASEASWVALASEILAWCDALDDAQLAAEDQQLVLEPPSADAASIIALWQALDDVRNPVPTLAGALRERLAQTRGPLILVSYDDHVPMLSLLARLWSAQAPVRWYRADTAALAKPPSPIWLAWPEVADGQRAQPLSARAQQVRQAMPTDQALRAQAAASVDQAQLLVAATLEGVATAVAGQVCAWLQQREARLKAAEAAHTRDRSKRVGGSPAGDDQTLRLGLVPLDRLLARRVRALLDRAQVLTVDAGGWMLSTTVAATSVMRWLDLVADNCPYRALSEWLATPFVVPMGSANVPLMADGAPADDGHGIESLPKPQAVAQAALHAGELDGLARRHGFQAGWDALVELTARHASRVQARAHQQGADATTHRAEAAFAPAADPEQALAIALAAWCQALQRIAKRMQGQRTPSAHARALLSALQQLGMTARLAEDAAGQQLLAVLQRLPDDLAEVDQPCGLSTFQALLAHAFEISAFVDQQVDSPIAWVPLDSLALGSFDAVVLVGADASNLPVRRKAGLLDAAMMAQLGMPTPEQDRLRQLRILGGWMARGLPTVVAVQGDSAQTLRLSPWLQRWFAAVDVLKPMLAQPAPHPVDVDEPDVSLALTRRFDQAVADALAQPGLRSVDAAADPAKLAQVPAPRAAQQIPSRWSVAQLQALVDCPYRFFARAVLQLNAGHAAADEREDPAEFGTAIHRVMQVLHQQQTAVFDARRRGLKPIDDAEIDALAEHLTQTGLRVFEQEARGNPGFVRLIARWHATVRPLAQCLLERVAQGWTWDACEVPLQRQWTVPVVPTDQPVRRATDSDASDVEPVGADAHLWPLSLHGRADRIDRRLGPGEHGPRGDGAWALIDFKTGDPAALRRAAKASESSVQLSAYALLMQGFDSANVDHSDLNQDAPQVAQAAYLTVRRGQSELVELQEAPDEAAQALEQRMLTWAARLAGGASMPADGAPDVCARCEAAGLCRRPWRQGEALGAQYATEANDVA